MERKSRAQVHKLTQFRRCPLGFLLRVVDGILFGLNILLDLRPRHCEE